LLWQEPTQRRRPHESAIEFPARGAFIDPESKSNFAACRSDTPEKLPCGIAARQDALAFKKRRYTGCGLMPCSAKENDYCYYP